MSDHSFSFGGEAFDMLNKQDQILAIRLFVEQTNQCIQMLKDSYEERHFDDLKFYCHKLAGTYRSFGIHLNFEIAYQLEKSAVREEVNEDVFNHLVISHRKLIAVINEKYLS